MANEATLVTRTAHPISKTCANGSTIEKGAFLTLTDPNTIATHSGALQNVIGIAAAEKIANDGVTQLAVYQEGIFKVYLSGTCAVGDPLAMDASVNHVKSVVGTAAAGLSGSKIVGRALETGTTGETILFELNPIMTGI